MKKISKKKSSQKTGLKKVKPEVFDGGYGELERALLYAEDIFGRAMIQFCVAGEMARQMRDGEKLHQLPCINLVILEKHIKGEPKKFLKTVIEGPFKVSNMNYKVTSDLVEFASLDGVPIRAKIIKKDIKYFENSDTVFYGVGEYRIPNPWDKYWKVKNLVR